MPGISLHSKIFQSRWMRRAYIRLYFAYKRYWEDPYATLVRTHPEFFRNGDLLDVGANVGYTSLLFLPMLDSAHRIYAFEPEAANQLFFEESLSLFSHDRAQIVLIKTAVGERSGTLRLGLSPKNPGDHRIVADEERGLEVPCGSLDEFTAGAGIQSRIGFIKIDVQGYEAKVCAGMVAVIDANPQCIVAFEYSPAMVDATGESAHDLLGFFAKRGFVLYQLDRKNGLQPFMPGTLPKRGYIDLVASRNNLL